MIRLLAIWKNIANTTYHGDSQRVPMLPKGKTFSNSSFCTFGPNMTTGFIINYPVFNFKVQSVQSVQSVQFKVLNPFMYPTYLVKST